MARVFYKSQMDEIINKMKQIRSSLAKETLLLKKKRALMTKAKVTGKYHE